MVELRHLRYFIAVAEERHFGRAADRLHMAQPPLSNQIKQLEAELGTVLLERTTRRVDLTEAGALLLERARQILADVEATEIDVAEVGRGAAGVLRLGFSGTATYRLMPEIVRVARERLPLVRLQISGEMLTPHMEEALLENRLDIAVLRPPVRSAQLELDQIQASRLVVALHRHHPLAADSGPISIEELAEEDLVSYPQGSSVFSVVAELARQAGFRPRIVQEATETSTLIALVGAGLGVSFLPGSQSLPLNASIVIRPLADDVSLGLATAWKSGNDSPLLTSFIQLIRESAENLENLDQQSQEEVLEGP
ncbi:LysR family transcriptional regulator [Enteractinococcus fodinae]|uniref:DNA-binding transcriptional LysR family regulator n=1 Tax=Enteractinococcus fodinae TaxID=684663 RepID=A0ABU2AX40_9MICC|nr:LysR substrate-binding domain-containing protein [Enteractinococcus fodinae]MDR7345920.1 DNA-binding transcriptional LysR family regulator [Enteractinococcus fodinae]